MALRDDYTCVAVDIDDEGIAWVTFNRPEKRNAMNPTLHYEMEEIMVHLETDPAAKVIVLTGAGKAWSAGMDLKEYFRETDNDPDAQFRSFIAHRHWGWTISPCRASRLSPWSTATALAARSCRCATATS